MFVSVLFCMSYNELPSSSINSVAGISFLEGRRNVAVNVDPVDLEACSNWARELFSLIGPCDRDHVTCDDWRPL